LRLSFEKLTPSPSIFVKGQGPAMHDARALRNSLPGPASIAADPSAACHLPSDGKTALLISHRFSTVRMADRIVVLENGKIADQGSRDHLLSLAAGTQACSKCRLRIIDELT